MISNHAIGYSVNNFWPGPWGELLESRTLTRIPHSHFRNGDFKEVKLNDPNVNEKMNLTLPVNFLVHGYNLFTFMDLPGIVVSAIYIYRHHSDMFE